jgi:mannose-6-phosphate isomerase-like protein (cupin superfamily)
MPDTTTAPPRYPGPLALGVSLSQLALTESTDATFTRDGPRADAEYRDLGWAAATNGAIGAKHIRAITPFEKETGWHWHDMNAHFVVVLKGWITFRYAGVAEPVTVHAGGTLSQPAGVAHNVVARSDDMELIEINLPAKFGAWDLPEFDPLAQGTRPAASGR